MVGELLNGQSFVDLVDDGGKVLFAMEEVHVVDLDDERLALVVVHDEVLVAAVQTLEIVDLNLLFVVASTLLDVTNEVRDAGSEVDHQVGHLDHVHHLLEELHVGLEVTIREVALFAVVGHEDIDALEDAAVLNDGVVGLVDVEDILEPLLEEVDLKRKRPSLDVVVVVLKIRIVADRLEPRFPAIMLGQHRGERGLAASYVSCNCYMHCSFGSFFQV